MIFELKKNLTKKRKKASGFIFRFRQQELRSLQLRILYIYIRYNAYCRCFECVFHTFKTMNSSKRGLKKNRIYGSIFIFYK